jgi:hypothetical protein
MRFAEARTLGSCPLSKRNAILAFSPIRGAPAASESGGIGWYLGTGIGGGFEAKYKLNGQTISIEDRLRGTTEQSPLIGINLINGGITLGRRSMLGLHLSSVANIETIEVAGASKLGSQLTKSWCRMALSATQPEILLLPGDARLLATHRLS